MTIRTPLSENGWRVLAWTTEASSGRAGVNLLIERILIDMVAAATAQDRATVI